jgi:nicotinamidase-related amidase
LPSVGGDSRRTGGGTAGIRERGREKRVTIGGVIDDPNAALLVVDVQKGFDDAEYWGPRNNPDCEANIAALLAHWREKDRPVVFVRHDSDEGASPLRPDNPGNAFKDVVTGDPDVVVSKHTNSCFYGDPDLHQWLKDRRIKTLVLCGITTNHCCETTARMGGNLGYDVRFVLDATHTFDRGDMTADQLAHATATNLDGEFATIVRTAEVLDA